MVSACCVGFASLDVAAFLFVFIVSKVFLILSATVYVRAGRTVVSSALPQTHVVSPGFNLHFFLCALLQVYPVRRWLRHVHVVHGLS